jgi:hypothetical protein
MSQNSFLQDIFFLYINKAAADTAATHEPLSLVLEQLVCTSRPSKIQSTMLISIAGQSPSLRYLWYG